jgi:hypothetical protein
MSCRRYRDQYLDEKAVFGTFIERSPKDQVVEEAFRELAENGYVATRPDPAVAVFKIAQKLRKRVQHSGQVD